MKSCFVSPKFWAILVIPVVLTACKGGGKGNGISKKSEGGLDYVGQLTSSLVDAVGQLPVIGWLF